MSALVRKIVVIVSYKSNSGMNESMKTKAFPGSRGKTLVCKCRR